MKIRSGWRAILFLLVASGCVSPAICATQSSESKTHLIHSEELGAKCGLYSLYCALSLAGQAASLDQLKTILPQDLNRGVSVYDLETALSQLQITTSSQPFSAQKFSRDKGAVGILFLRLGEVGLGHFVALQSLGEGRIQVLDFPRNPEILSEDAPYFSDKQVLISLHPNTNPPRQATFTPSILLAVLGCMGLLWLSRKSALALFSRHTSGIAMLLFCMLFLPGCGQHTANTNALTCKQPTVVIQALNSEGNKTFYQHTYTIENPTNETVRVLRHQTDCICTKIICPKTIEPNGTAKLTAFVEKTSWQNGSNHVSIAMEYLLGEERKILPLKLTLEQQAITFAEPAKLEFGKVETWNKPTKAVTIYTPSDLQAIVEASSQELPPGIQLARKGQRELRYGDIPYDVHEYDVSLNPDQMEPQTQHRLSFSIKSKKGNQETYIDLSAERLPDVRLSQETLFFTSNSNEPTSVMLVYDPSRQHLTNYSIQPSDFHIERTVDHDFGKEFHITHRSNKNPSHPTKERLGNLSFTLSDGRQFQVSLQLLK